MIFNLAYNLHGNLGKMITNQDPTFSEIQVEYEDYDLDRFSKKLPNREFTCALCLFYPNCQQILFKS